MNGPKRQISSGILIALIVFGKESLGTTRATYDRVGTHFSDRISKVSRDLWAFGTLRQESFGYQYCAYLSMWIEHTSVIYLPPL